jgi:hypothetical protein
VVIRGRSLYTETVNTRRWLAVFAATALILPLLGAGSAGAASQDPKTREAHPPHKVLRSATPTYQGGYQPSQLATAYGFAGLACYGSGSCGAGQTIAIVDAYDNPTIASDLAAFDAQFGLPCNNCLKKLTPQGPPKTDAGWALEESLDVEWAHAMAPAATILLVEATSASLTSLFSAVDYAVSQGASAISMSWGTNEFLGETTFDSHFTAPGVTFTASSGDSGPGVIYPAVSPTVTAVGGTTLPLDAAGNQTGEETGWSGSGGGVSAYEPAPGYQSMLGATGRAVPDVAYDAAPTTGVAIYDTTPYNGQAGWFVVGGTSAGAPQWAALAAIIDSQRSSRLGAANAALYGLPPAGFRDITSPSPAVPGFDTATGLGSPRVGTLVSALAPTSVGSIAFVTTPQTLTAGQVSGPITVQLSSVSATDVTVTFGSTSAGASFSTAPDGTRSAAVSVTIPAGSLSSPSVYYEDTKAGTPSVTASAFADGFGSAGQSETVAAGPLATLSVSPGSATVAVGSTQSYNASGADSFGNAVPVSPSWSVSPSLGSFSPTAGTQSTFTASATGSGTVVATAGALSATSSLTVIATQQVRVASITYTAVSYFGITYILVTVVNGSGTPVSGAALSVATYRNGTLFGTASGTTNSLGRDLFVITSTPTGCYSTTVTKLTATGYTWDGVSPPNQYCK